MKFSENWLREWVNPNLDTIGLSEQMTMAGLEVNSIKPVANMFHGVVVGEIIECNQHPIVDKIYVTKVKIEENIFFNIICSAPNCRIGLKVAVATNEATLLNNFKIKTIKLYDQLSEGMLCSFSELGLPEENNINIIELPLDAPIGTDIYSYLQLYDNTIDISVPSNRADCLSILGIARDVAVLNNLPLNRPVINPLINTIFDVLKIKVETMDICPLYLGRIIKNIKINSTPLWMREKLRRCGINSVNSIIDITNYVLLELGQPIQAFDMNGIDGDIVVRMAKDGESLVSIDDNIINLDTDTLVIADNNKVLAIAGIIYGKYLNINANTRSLFLESAFFNPLFINNCSRRYGLYSDSSHRYERGVDPNLQYKAIERTTQLVLDICGGEVGPIIAQVNKKKLPKCATIKLRRKKLDVLIGHVIKDEQVTNILLNLGCKITIKKNAWEIVVPSWRFDLLIEEDLIEEVVRIYGYKHIPNIPIQADLIMTQHSETNLSLKRVKDFLVDKGYYEAITYSFVNPNIQQLLHPNEEALMISNPISQDMSVMRVSLWTGLLATLAHNNNHQQNRVRLFESGLRFITNKKSNFGVFQDFVLSGVVSGRFYEEQWGLDSRIVDFYDLKGELESLLDLTGKLEQISFRLECHPALHPGQSAALYLYNERIGFMGALHPQLEKKFNFRGKILLFELLWNKISDRVLPHVHEISRFPANRRDISVVVDEDIPTGNILKECKNIGINHLVSLKLLDIYRGEGIQEGKKSLTISLIFQDTNGTLGEEEITILVTKCIKFLEQLFQATLRNSTYYDAYKS